MILTTDISSPAAILTKSPTSCQLSALCRYQVGPGTTFSPALMLMRDEMECKGFPVVLSPAQASSLGRSGRYSQGFLHIHSGFAALSWEGATWMEYILGFLSNWLYLQWMRKFLKCHLNAILPLQGSLIKDFLYIHGESGKEGIKWLYLMSFGLKINICNYLSLTF